jgi:kinesin family protein 13
VEKFDETKAHLVNLNEDPMLSRKIKYSLADKATLRIGRKNAEPPNDIVLGGVGVRSHHASIVQRDGAYYLEPTADEGESNCFVNGQLVSEPTRMFNEDRLVLGSNSTFLLLLPGEERRIGPEAPAEIDW